MTRRLLVLVALALAVAAAPSAQTGAPTGATHTFQVRDGEVYLNGRLLPNAVPAELDLSGLGTGLLEFSGPVAPVITVDRQVYVLEEGRLVRLEESARSESEIYIMSGVGADAPQNLPRERVTPLVEAVYMQEVAARNGQLYQKMQREQQMEAEALQLAERVRALPDGAERNRLQDRLRRRLSDLLSLRHEVQGEELALAAARLDALRARLAEQEAQHDALVDRRLRALIGPDGTGQ